MMQYLLHVKWSHEIMEININEVTKRLVFYKIMEQFDIGLESVMETSPDFEESL